MKALLLLPALALAACAALVVGARPVPLPEVWAALSALDPSNPDHLAITQLRLPRLYAGLIAGTALGLAGALMQALTRNPWPSRGYWESMPARALPWFWALWRDLARARSGWPSAARR
ncbi:iron chelate uptake ABC transporter family permease subunit [Paracoccus cavernae]|uniref:Iron chelate uptake ABC transporter family permease subunit n=1 Tax=Paracoccus cavernae TaxID=1571207 RepID=A0ABT8D3B5_9RHOB|nr:iron chelate uptake ABC transporter family permease subunit [Paracoccus cavernae]